MLAGIEFETVMVDVSTPATAFEIDLGSWTHGEGMVSIVAESAAAAAAAVDSYFLDDPASLTPDSRPNPIPSHQTGPYYRIVPQHPKRICEGVGHGPS